jgi:hypothetical protein
VGALVLNDPLRQIVDRDAILHGERTDAVAAGDQELSHADVVVDYEHAPAGWLRVDMEIVFADRQSTRVHTTLVSIDRATARESRA